MAGVRKNIPAATQAALWAMSSGRCYAPGCQFPVVVEIRPGVYRKNAQIGHIYGVALGAPRFNPAIPDEERDAFTNLLLLCLPHHGEVDDKKTGERMYPPQLLRQWKTKHEGSYGPALALIGQVDEDGITALLEQAFTPPIERLQSIADQLERTGTLNQAAVLELQQVVNVLRESPGGVQRETALMLSTAADILGTSRFASTGEQISTAADILGTSRFASLAQRLSTAADTLSSGSYDRVATTLEGAADSLAHSVNWLQRHRGSWEQ